MSDQMMEDPAVVMGETVAGAYEAAGGRFRRISREALAHDLADILKPLLNICTNAEWIEAINARLERLEKEMGEEGPRLTRFGADGEAEMSVPTP